MKSIITGFLESSACIYLYLVIADLSLVFYLLHSKYSALLGKHPWCVFDPWNHSTWSCRNLYSALTGIIIQCDEWMSVHFQRGESLLRTTCPHDLLYNQFFYQLDLPRSLRYFCSVHKCSNTHGFATLTGLDWTGRKGGAFLLCPRWERWNMAGMLFWKWC